MARIINTKSKPIYGIRITNYFKKDGKVAYDFTDIYTGDTVTKLQYVKDNETVSVSGKVADVNIHFDKATVKPGFTEGSFLSTDAKVASVTVDHSTKNNSAIDVINPREILEYNTEETDIVRVTVTPIIKVDFTSSLSDGSSSSITFEEGLRVFGLTIADRGVEFTDDYKVSAFNYKLTSNGVAVIIGVVLISATKAFKVLFSNIKSTGKEGIVVTDAEEIAGAISDAIGNEDVGGVVLPKAKFEDELALNGDINIVGNQTEFEGKVTCSNNAVVSISGVKMTEDAYLLIQDAAAVKFTDCEFTDAKPYQAKSYLVLGQKNGPTLLEFDGCTFGDNQVDGNNKFYNLFELNTVVANGSYIRNCTFKKAACNHNVINLYDVEENATITIENNTFEKSANAVRIGFKGDAHCTVNLINNTYLETDSNVDYAGLLIVQPYITSTTSMANVNINIDGTVNKSGVDQVAYIYYNETDTHITGELVPNVTIDGVKTQLREITG